MSKPRIELQDILEEILGSRNVYFQPPESIKLKYPCIVYQFQGMANRHADNIVYKTAKQYQVTYITKDPDTEDFTDILLARLPYSRYDRHFVSDNLNHEVFTVYF